MGKRRIVAADFETDPFKHGRVPGLVSGGWFDGVRYEDWFGDGEDWLPEFLALCQGRTVYMHNGGRFDFHYFLDQADDLMMINRRIARMRVGDAIFIDSYALLPIPLRDHDKDTDFDYGKLEADVRNLHRDEILAYQKRDVLSLHALVSEFIEEHGAALTMASAAVKSLRTFDYEIPRITEAQDAKLRPWYFGGRVEALKTGELGGGWELADVNSAYPSAMSDGSHPYGERMIVGAPVSDTECQFHRFRARATGAFPVRTAGGTVYPRDEEIREFHATCWELRAAEDHGLLRDVTMIETLTFPETRDFEEYVAHHHARRMEAKARGDVRRVLYHKLFMNSLYGRFGIDPRRFQEYAIEDTGQWPSRGGFGWRELYDVEHSDRTVWSRPAPSDRFANVATAASVTGYARARLLEAIVDTDPVYCDTDSVISRNTGLLDMGPSLGQWQVEMKIDELWIAGRKLYAARFGKDWKVASKGAKLGPSDVRKICEGGTVVWKSEAPSFGLGRGPMFVERELGRNGREK